MKKTVVLVTLLGLGVLIGTGCTKKEESGQARTPPVDTALSAQTVQPAAAVYYCPMDPEIVSDKPAKCSKCGMDLIEKPAETK